VHSFLCYGADVEIALTQAGCFVAAHTNVYPLYEFWVCALHNPRRIVHTALHFYPIKSEMMFKVLQGAWREYDGHYTRAGMFFLLNQCSSTGLISCGELKNENFTPRDARRLDRFRVGNLHLVYDEGEDYLDGVSRAADADYLLFPVGKYSLNLFEEGTNRGAEMTLVNHKKLRAKLETQEKKWLAIYKYHPQVLRDYENYNVTMISKYGQPTKHQKMCEDIVIANF